MQSKKWTYYFNLLSHSNCNDIVIYQSVNFLYLESKEKFNAFFPPKNKIDFNSPIEFEPHFDEYLSKYNTIRTTKKFKYHNNMTNRDNLSAFIKNYNYFWQTPNFFGCSRNRKNNYNYTYFKI